MEEQTIRQSNTMPHHLPLWLGQPLPRYTSYPPAPAFHEKVDRAVYARSLINLVPDEPVSLYQHIPFCQSLCLYCGCNTTVTQREDRINQYLKVLQQEMALVSELGTSPLKVSHLHFGGGTPNILTDSALKRHFEALHEFFDLTACHEIAMEMDPRVTNKNQIKTLAGCGLTRVSLGVQDFAPEVQALIRRVQPYDLVAKVCDWLQSSGITSINFDLMYGLPHQTVATVAETTEQVCRLNPSRVALFSYAHVPQLKPHQRALIPHGIPGDHERLAMDRTARAILSEAGYTEIGIDHFARSDDSLTRAIQNRKLKRNFQGYTDDVASTLLAFGASSISQTPDGFFQNERDSDIYGSLIRSGKFAVHRGFLTSQEDRLRARVIEELMCYLSADLDALCAAFDLPLRVLEEDLRALASYEQSGLITRTGHLIALQSPYRMAIRAICRIFDRYTVNGTPTSRAA